MPTKKGSSKAGKAKKASNRQRRSKTGGASRRSGGAKRSKGASKRTGSRKKTNPVAMPIEARDSATTERKVTGTGSEAGGERVRIL
jgi:hypothetical protein